MYTFQVQNENGRAVTGMYEWTSLNRAENLLVLQNLPDKLSALFPQPHASEISTLWKVWTQQLHVYYMYTQVQILPFNVYRYMYIVYIHACIHVS